MTVANKISRRRLLRQASGAALAGIALPLFTSCRKQPTSGTGEVPSEADEPTPGPNDRMGVGIIGCGRRNGQLVIGKGGLMLKNIGSSARKDMELLLGSKVFLKLFVRVQKEWSKDLRALKEFGYR